MSCEFKVQARFWLMSSPIKQNLFDLVANSDAGIRQARAHTGAVRTGALRGQAWARTTRPGGEGWPSGDGDGDEEQEQVFVVLRGFQPLLQIAAAAALFVLVPTAVINLVVISLLAFLVMKLVFPIVRKQSSAVSVVSYDVHVLQPAACRPFRLQLMTVCSSEIDGLPVVLSGSEIEASGLPSPARRGRAAPALVGWTRRRATIRSQRERAITIKPITINHQPHTRRARP